MTDLPPPWTPQPPDEPRADQETAWGASPPPPPPPPVVADVTERRRRWPVVVAIAVAAVLGAGAATAGVLVLTRDPKPAAPAKVIAEAAARLDDAGGFRFKGTTRLEFGAGQGGGSSVIRTTSEGSAIFPDRFRIREDDDGTFVDSLRVGGDLWTRTTVFKGQLDKRPWGKILGTGVELDPSINVGGDAEVLFAIGPDRLVEHLRSATNAADEGTKGGNRIVGAALPAKSFKALPDGTKVLTAKVLVETRDKELVSLSVELTSDTDVARFTYELVELKRPTDIHAPGANELDATPLVDEEDIAQVKGVELLGLTSVPKGWTLAGVYVVTKEQSSEGCEQVGLDYVDPNNDTGGYLGIYLIPASCSGLEPLTDPQPFTAGAFSGSATVDPQAGTFGTMRVRDTIVQFDTDLVLADVARVLAAIAPLDPLAPLTEIPGVPSAPS